MNLESQTAFLADLKENETEVAIYLENGIRLNACVIESFDDDSLIVSCIHGDQLVYKRCINTILLARR